MTRTCPRCKKEKPTKDFPKDKTRKSGLGSWCSNCKNLSCRIYYYTGGKIKSRLRNKKWRKTPPGKLLQRRARLKKRYGLNIAQYNELLKKQRGLCALCGLLERTRQKGQLRALAVDHNHETGVVRGLLCQRCNIALGHIEKNIELLPKIVKYLTGLPHVSESRQSIINVASAALKRKQK